MRKFIRTRPATPPLPPPTDHHNLYHKTNGHANGGAGGGAGVGAEVGDGSTGTLSRWWSGSEESDVDEAGEGGECGGCGGCGACAGCGGCALWEDAQFPARARALGGGALHCRVRWRRPQEICTRPVFYGAGGGEGGPRWAVQGGALGGAPVALAAAALAPTPRLLARAVPPQRRAHAAIGRYRFRVWEFGAWRDLWVDDRLPTRAVAASGRALYSRGGLPDDFTLPLLEKAHAKWRGSYSALRMHSVAEALRALSGGVVQSFETARTAPAALLRALDAAVPRSTLCVAWRLGPGPGPGPGPGGSVALVSGLARVRGGAPLVRVRSVSGAGAGGGEGGEGSTWRALPPPDRDVLAARDDPDDSWLSLSEFVSAFPQLELVHVPPDEWVREPALHARRPWRAALARRRWRVGYNAGGAPSAASSASASADANPQFQVQVRAHTHLVVAVAQRGTATTRLAVGFSAYGVPEGAGSERRLPLRALPALEATHEARAPEVAAFFSLPPGRYLVVPHTRLPHLDAPFLLRILTDERADVWEVNEDNDVVCGGALDPGEGEALGGGVVGAVRLAAAACARDGELEAGALRAALRRVWRECLEARPSLALCRALVPLGDAALRGALPAGALPALVARLATWRAAWRSAVPGAAAGNKRRRSAYGLRALLAASGARVSNKVLEALVVVFGRGGGRWLRHDDYVMALARLHAAHARHRALDARHKASPVSLEEMILMTIYT